MNDICKARIRERLIESLKKEGLPTNTAGGLLRISPSYLSMVKNPQLWVKVTHEVWDNLQKWVNSGMGIEKYSSSGGKIVQGKVVIVPEANVEDAAHGASESVASKRKDNTESDFSDELSVTLSQLISVFTQIREGMSVKDVAKKLNVAEIIVKIIQDNLVLLPAHLVELDMDKLRKDMENSPIVSGPRHEKVVMDLEINILLNGQKIKIG